LQGLQLASAPDAMGVSEVVMTLHVVGALPGPTLSVYRRKSSTAAIPSTVMTPPARR
jgi:hypothetical protein